MPLLRRLLVTAQLDAAGRRDLEAAAGDAECVYVSRDDAGTLKRALAGVDAAFIEGDLDRRFLDAPALRWVHCDHAGLERSARPSVFARGIRLSGAAGRSAPALAEHALYFMLSLSYDAPALLALQRARRWAPFRPEHRRALAGRTLGIVGLGHTGRALALRAHALEMRVIAFRRRVCDPPPGVAEVFAADAGGLLADLLGQSDIVVLAASLSDRTHHMIDDAALACMQRSALLVNVARGGLIDEAALLRALRRRRIAGAGLDTVAAEPLSLWSPLWRAPNLQITPHQTPPLVDRSARSLAIACENLRRYRADRPLLNELGPEDVYSHTEHERALSFSPRALVARLRSAKRGLPG